MNLHRLCRSLLRTENPTLPTERELVSLLSASLMTVRKAVNQCIQDGLIIRNGRRTTIVPDRPLSRLGRILFLSGNDVPALLPGFERLWLKVRSEIELLGGQVDCLVDTPNDDIGKFRRFCDLFDVILLSGLAPGPYCGQKLSYLKSITASRNVIALSDTYADDFSCVIALDNNLVGHAAAEYMNHKGCHHALVLGCLENVVLYQKRLNSFREAFQGKCEWVYRTEITLQDFFLNKELEEIKSGILRGIDAIFFATDEWTPLLTENLFSQGLSPDRIKLITSNGCGDCFQCIEPIPSLTRVTSLVTFETIKQLRALAKDRKCRVHRRLIPPELCIITHDDIFHQSLKWHCLQNGIE